MVCFGQPLIEHTVRLRRREGRINFEQIGVPPLDKRRGDANYSLLDEHGVVKLRHPIYTDKDGKTCGGGSVYVQKGDVIIGKVVRKGTKSGEEELSDNSLVLRKGENGYVDRIFISTTPNGYKLVKVVIRKIRIPEVGDKFCSPLSTEGYSRDGLPTRRYAMD